MDPLVGGLRAATRLGAVTPDPVARRMAQALAFTAARTSPDARRMVARHLRRVRGDQPNRLIRERDIQKVFDSYARYWLDVLKLPSWSSAKVDSMFRIEGYEHVQASLEGGTAPIFALPHLGSWEVAARWLVDRGHRVSAVVEDLDSPELYEWFRDFRESMGVRVIPLDSRAGTEVAAAVSRGEIMCLLCDRDISGNGIEVEFFGEVTRLPGGPALAALRSGAPLIPVGVYTEGRNIRAVVRKPLEVAREGRLRDDVTRITQALARELELLIRREPHQWHLLQPNWPSDYEAVGLEWGQQR
jgi:phosphatidylinositol dimannoside acyltransferase